MNKTLEKVAEAAAAIERENPEARAHYLQGIAEAQEARKAAAQAKIDAETEEAFNRACDDESHARDKESFYRRQLERMEFTPRMEEAEYFGHVDAVKATVEKAAEDFRKAAEKAVKEIAAARAAYLATVTEADTVLNALDAASNVLQVKHRYRTKKFIGAAPEEVEDRNEWKRHALRYNNGKAYDLVAKEGTGWNDFVCAAWTAADRVS